MRLNIGALWCGRTGGVRSRDYQIFWDGWISLAMGLRPRARVELRYKNDAKICKICRCRYLNCSETLLVIQERKRCNRLVIIPWRNTFPFQELIGDHSGRLYSIYISLTFGKSNMTSFFNYLFNSEE